MTWTPLLVLTIVAQVGAMDPVDKLTLRDPAKEAERAFAAGDKRYLVVPVCSGGGEVIPGWPNEPESGQAAISSGHRPISCAQFGEDPKQQRFMKVAKYAEAYNLRMRALNGIARR